MKWLCLAWLTVAAHAAPVSLRESLVPSAVQDIAAGTVRIAGTAPGPQVKLRVTTSSGGEYGSCVTTKEGRFEARFPQDFPGALLAPGLLYVDATDVAELDGKDLIEHQAEATLVLVDSAHKRLPDLPQPFTDDLVDADGRKDARCSQWSVQCAMVNRFMHSRAASVARIGRREFDMAKAADFAFFKEHLTLYDFDHRDRDWSQPLNHRVARGFWQAVWNTWFNASNDHPWDGNADNHAQTNYQPYTFTNDLADLLVLNQMRRDSPAAPPDHRDGLCNEVLANLLALQHRGAENFAQPEASGKQERYTAGAFRYGMFETGEWMTEGTGWFANPKFGDHRHGGVFNGRAVWALGESLKAHPHGPQATKVSEAIALALRFCLHDALAPGYAREPKPGLVFWKDAGEHGYLLLGMTAACEVAPEMRIKLADNLPAQSLRELCATTLDASVASVKPTGRWTGYPDQDAMAIAALAAGAQVLTRHPNRDQWLHYATKAADAWMAAKVDPAERSAPCPHFGYIKGDGMTYHLGGDNHVHITLYIAGHWMHALARLYAVTGDKRYAERWNALTNYLCGDNPFRARMLNELGAVYNAVRDTDGDGIEDELKWDAYPESTAFVQIGLLHGLHAGAWQRR